MAKKIGAIASLSVIGVLIILTIIFACVKFDYGIKCNAPDQIFVVQSSAGGRRLIEDNEEIETIKKYISNASNEKYITALFNGRLNQKAEIVNDTKTLDKPSAYYIVYSYNQPQTLKYGKKDYKDSNGNTFKYRELVFDVVKTEGETTVKVYIKPFYNDDGTEYNDTKYTKYYELQADLSGLYNYLADKY